MKSYTKLGYATEKWRGRKLMMKKRRFIGGVLLKVFMCMYMLKYWYVKDKR